MKDLKQINKEIGLSKSGIERLTKEWMKEKVPAKEKRLDTARNKERKNLELLYEIKKYLEFSPTEQFCENEVKRLTNIIDLAYDAWEKEVRRRIADNPKFENLPQKNNY
ncbi:MAG: hypothetical protein [Bacteriophage sp.]|nr:MAG: hypothetical protein [Bacteriophage sp.]